MTGSKTRPIERRAALVALKNQSSTPDYLWDGESEDDKPLTAEEMTQGMDLAKKRRGRPFSDEPKKLVTLRLDAETIMRFRKSGPGWQTWMNSALRQWLDEHPDLEGSV